METNQNTQPTAEPAQPQASPQTGSASTATETDYTALFDRLDKIMEKRKEGLARSALKDNGVEEAEIGDIVKAWRESKVSKAAKQETGMATLTAENNRLRAQMEEEHLGATVRTIGASLGVDEKNLPYLQKLADLSEAKAQDGKPDSEKIKSALQKVLDDVPALRTGKKTPAATTTGIVPVGAGSANTDNEEAEKKRLRSYFGLN